MGQTRYIAARWLAAPLIAPPLPAPGGPRAQRRGARTGPPRSDGACPAGSRWACWCCRHRAWPSAVSASRRGRTSVSRLPKRGCAPAAPRRRSIRTRPLTSSFAAASPSPTIASSSAASWPDKTRSAAASTTPAEPSYAVKNATALGKASPLHEQGGLGPTNTTIEDPPPLRSPAARRSPASAHPSCDRVPELTSPTSSSPPSAAHLPATHDAGTSAIAPCARSDNAAPRTPPDRP